MNRHFDYKVPSGKLLRIDADVNGDVIRDITICGDFFIYPEDGISRIEDSLRGQKIDGRLTRRKLDDAMQGLETIGLSADDIMAVLDKFIS